MIRLLGRGPLVVAWGFVLAVMLVSQVRGAAVYEITVTVVDNTTHATNTFTAVEGTTHDVTDPGSPNAVNTINIGGAAWATFQSTTGLTLSGFNSVTNNPGTSQATVSLGGTVQVTATADTNSYTVTTTVSQVNFNSPVGATGTLKDSTSSTISNTMGAAGPPADSQSIQSWYDPTNTLNGMTGPHTPMGSYLLAPTINTTLSPGSPTLVTVFSPASASPFSMTEQIVVNITGNGGTGGVGAQAKDVFGGTLTLTATPSIPEPSSVVLILAGMPLPLMVVRMLRRRRAAVAG